VWRRGRVTGITTAADKMFNAMSMRGGGPVALEYLKAMSGSFQVEAVSKPGNGEGFTFNVTMPGDDNA
jgi:hypothetical protein